MDSSIDTILEFDNEDNEIINGILHIVSDTSILITYEETNGSVTQLGKFRHSKYFYPIVIDNVKIQRTLQT